MVYWRKEHPLMNEKTLLHKRLEKELDRQKKESLFRNPSLVEWKQGNTIITNHTEQINFCSNDYLNLSSNETCQKALVKAVNETKTGSGSSRLVSGNSKELADAEAALADFFQYESALLFPSGYQANFALLSTLFHSEDTLFYDKQVHASMIKGMALSPARKKGFNHNDFQHLKKRLHAAQTKETSESRHGGARVLVVESCYSMKGDTLPFTPFKEISAQNQLFTIVDEAHALAVCGPKGRGLCAGANFKPDILIGAMGKAFGIMGAFILCSQTVKEYLINFASPLIYTTAMPPFLARYIQTLLPQIESMDSQRQALSQLSRWTKEQFQQNGIAVEGECHILALPIGEEEKAAQLAQYLQTRGFYTAAIRFPTVARGKAIIRISLTAGHTQKEISSLIKAIVDFQKNRVNLGL